MAHIADFQRDTPFTYGSTKTEVWGKSDKYHTFFSGLLFWGAVILGGGLALLFMFIPALIVILLGVFLSSVFMKEQSFRADLCAKTWSASSDEYWEPVKKDLGL